MPIADDMTENDAKLHEGDGATRRLAILPQDTVLFPTMPLPVHLTQEGELRMAGDCLDGGGEFGVVLRELLPDEAAPSGSSAPGDPRPIGTVARIISYERISESHVVLNTRGTERFVIESIEQKSPYLVAAVRILPPLGDPLTGLHEKTRRLHALYDHVLLVARREGKIKRTIPVPQEIEPLAWFIAATAPLEPHDGQRLLQADSLKTLIDAELALLQTYLNRHEG